MRLPGKLLLQASGAIDGIGRGVSGLGAPLLAALGSADPAGRCALVKVLGRLGGPKALEAVRAAAQAVRMIAAVENAG